MRWVYTEELWQNEGSGDAVIVLQHYCMFSVWVGEDLLQDFLLLLFVSVIMCALEEKQCLQKLNTKKHVKSV